MTDAVMERMTPRGVGRVVARRNNASFKQENRAFPGKGAHSIAGMKKISSRARPPALPNKPPEFWPGKCHAPENEKDVAIFFRRVWAQYLVAGLTLSYLKKKDLRLYNSINNYQITYGKPWPEDLKMETPKTRLASVIDRLKTEGPKALTPRELLAAARKLVRERHSNPLGTSKISAKRRKVNRRSKA